MDTPIARRLSPTRADSIRERVSLALRRYAERDGRGYPDWAMRYKPIVRRLRLLEPVSSPILEVGANENGLSRFVPAQEHIVAVDCSLPHLKAARLAGSVLPVVADIAHLPFRDHSFEVVVSVDTLEHVPPRDRDDSIAELGRVLTPSGRAAMSFPSGETSRQAERCVSAEYANLTGRSLRWLEEHAEHGLPDAHDTSARWQSVLTGTHRVHATGNANLILWKWVWRILLNTWPTRANAIAQVLLHAATPILTRAHWGTCYRTILFAEPHND